MIKALQLCLIIALIGSASAAIMTCDAIPQMAALQEFAELSKSVGANADTDYTEFTTQMTAVTEVATNSKAGEPYQVSSQDADMPYCTNYVKTKNSCCVTATNTALQNLIRRTYELRLGTLPKTLKQLESDVNSASQCIGIDAAKEIVDLLSDEITKQEAARINGLIVEMNWLRGQACSICSDTEDVDKVYANDKLSVLSTDITSYTDAMKVSNAEFNTANTTLRTKIAEALVEKAPTCTKVAAAIEKSFEDNKYEVDATTIDCEKSTMFGVAVENQYGGCVRFQEEGLTATDITTGFAAVVGAPKVYIENADDETEFRAIASTYITDLKEQLPEKVAVETTPTEDEPTPTEDKNDDSSSSVLYVSALLAIFLVLL